MKPLRWSPSSADCHRGVSFLLGDDLQARSCPTRRGSSGLTADRTAEKAAQYASHVEQLEARVRVLERIATDKGADLAQQIEDLRDVRRSLAASLEARSAH